MWETLVEIDLSTQWQYSLPTENNVFRFTVTQPFNLSGIAIAQAETGDITQLFDLQRLAIRPESEICVIEKPIFFNDRRLAVRAIAFASNKSVSGTLKVEGMSMALTQPAIGFSSGWQLQGNELISPTLDLLLSFDGEASKGKVFQFIPDRCLAKLDSFHYVARVAEEDNPLEVGLQLKIAYQMKTAQATTQSSSLQSDTEPPLEPTPGSYELGMGFSCLQDTFVLKMRFYKASIETGSHTGNIWSYSGELLATVAFSDENFFGWQEQTLETPLRLLGGYQYIISCNFNAYYFEASEGLPSSAVDGVSVLDGRYGTVLGSVPGTVYGRTNYFVDMVFQASLDDSNDPFSITALTGSLPVSSLKFSREGLSLPPTVNRDEADYNSFSLACDTGNPNYKLEGCAVLKYRLVWS